MIATTAPIPGQLAHNHSMNMDMHLVATYNDGTKGIYSDMLQKFAAVLKRRVKSDLQNVVVVTGRTGSGKSTLAIQLARAVAGPDWDLSANYIYGAQDFREKLRNGDVCRSVSLFDEGVVSFNSLTGNARDDRDMVVLLDVLRSWGMTTIICIPSFYDLNKRIREHLIDYLVVCPERPLISGYKSRGFFEVYRPQSMQWSDKTYWSNLGAGVFKPLDAKTDMEYQAIKLARQRDQVAKFLNSGKKDDEDEEEADE